MWFLFVEVFFLIATSFFLGAAVTSLALRIFLRSSDNQADSASEVTP